MKDEFFTRVRQTLFDGKLFAAQVDGLDAIIEAFQRAKGTDLKKLAYILATAYHETGRRMQPVREGFAADDAGAIAAVSKLFNEHKISVNYALRDRDTLQSYYGRGFVQITWKKNYKKMGDLLKLPLVLRPDMALQLDTSADILVKGMFLGLFTGKRLSDYINPTKTDYYGARKIINGSDKAAVIAEYAKKFEEALK